MCGIAGVIQTRRPDWRATDSPADRVERMVAMQRDRGPDHAAVVAIEHPRANAVLGHSRLSILDPSPGAHQPMQSHDGRYWLVFNGEIYNYRELRTELIALGHGFRTTSDTEVLLAAFARWGVASLPRLNGMFAFAIFDRRDSRLWLARDRFGVKPLYYVRDGDALYFASTERPLAVTLGLTPDPAWLATAIRYWVFDHHDAAPFRSMKSVPPGHVIEVRLAGSDALQTHQQRYHDLEQRVAETADALASRSQRSLTEELTAMLQDAVRLRLRSDVPAAVSLSGGLDSAAIATIAAQQGGGRIDAFTFGHPQARDSEGPIVAKLARRAPIDVHYVRPDQEAIVEAFHRTLASQGSPIANLSLVAQNLLFQAARRQGFKVILGGQGGDEVFLGYRKYQVFAAREALHRRRPDQAVWQVFWSIPTLLAELPSTAHYWRHRDRYSGRRDTDAVLRLPEPEPLRLGCYRHESLGARAIRDVTLTSLPSLLRYEDRNSMSNGVESRLPLLDYRLVEFGLALPSAMKLHRGWGKWILRQAVGDRIPREIRWARFKRGFSVDQAGWIDRGLGREIRTLLRQRWTFAQPWLMSSATPEELFSDRRLKQRGATLAEATALLWLAEVTERDDCRAAA
ncbi:MAG TPA: asparagine synthase (glutamine-hydrolyzing) [Planctomycetaceae bacterium]|nr:asparagine synthase (glutamine-hydrolyzing) [Planctomycetaceae bacterium]